VEEGDFTVFAGEAGGSLESATVPIGKINGYEYMVEHGLSSATGAWS